jgi:uncharacterized coiled-coil DUF342 family protein
MKTKKEKEKKIQEVLDKITNGFNSKYNINLDKNSSNFGEVKDKRKNYEAEVVKRKQGIENARDERELREAQDQMQNSFVSEFESGELVH